MRPRHASTLLFATLVSCSHPDGAFDVGLDASCWGRACSSLTADSGVFVAPVVEVDLPACPDSNLVTLPANTGPAQIDVHLSGPCMHLCNLLATTQCDDAGISWTTPAICTCVNGSDWSCVSEGLDPSSCGAPPYACPIEPLRLNGDAAAPLPTGRCNAKDSCSIRARELCADGSTGVTKEYGCGCPQDDAGFGRWSCGMDWSTAIGCDRPFDSVSVANADAGGYWIEVQGDGASYAMTSGLLFESYAACPIDAHLSGCLAAGTVPCISTDVTPGNSGTYTDRQGNYWKVTSISIEPAIDGGAIGGAAADGTLILSAVGEEGGTMRLVLSFHTPYKAYIC